MPSREAAEVLRLNQQLFTDLTADPAATPPELRRIYDELLATFAIPDGATFEEVDAGGIPAIWCSAPGSSTDHAVLHFHSGGYVIGSASGYRAFGARLAAATGARVLVPEYRLAPEHPFPAAAEDGPALYRWLRETHEAENIVVSGDSAGGGLMLVTLQTLRDAGDDLPAAGVGMSSWADLAMTQPSHEENKALDPILNADLLAALVGVYLADSGVDPKDPRVSPLYGDFTGLPPLLLMASAAETIRDDTRRVVEKVQEAGGEVRHVEAEGMCHIWPIFADRLPEARESIYTVGAFVEEHFAAARASG